MDWEEEYKGKLIAAQQAAQLVKSGDRVAFTLGRETHSIGLALAARKDELRDVKVLLPNPGHDFGWYDRGWEESFAITVGQPTATCQQMIDERRCDQNNFTCLVPFQIDQLFRFEPDIIFVELSPPDKLGFCSVGVALWNKKELIRRAKLVIAEVNKNLIRMCGDGYVHVSEIDYFVEHISSGGVPGSGSLAGREIKFGEPYVRSIAENVSSLINDGDTIQIGVGRTTEQLVRLGMFDNKQDIGYHSEATAPGIIGLVRRGIITGKRKTINKGLAVVTTAGGDSIEELKWLEYNPLFRLVEWEYLSDVAKVISAHDNMVAINQVLMVDLSGQIMAETIGTRIYSQAGGQTPFVVGALLSKGGRSITVLPSTAQAGTVSRIVALAPQGTAVTIPRSCADYIVTEYGAAALRGKSVRQRADELINIAHPDFRAELRREARRLLWP